MMATVTLQTTAVRFETTNSSNGRPPPRSPVHSVPLLSLPKPSWIVRTESNVRKERRNKPDPPCVVCKGSGRVDCAHCHGRGRTNHINLQMLPKGEWPKWCKSCGGSGLDYCSRCLGTGEYRYIMGFHFMSRDTDQTQGQKKQQVLGNSGSQSAADIFQNDARTNSIRGR